MDQKVFDKFRRLIYEKSGITLNHGKEALVSARVSKRMRSRGVDSYRDYLDLVMHDQSGEEVVQLLDAISTNVTNFFRENEHFDFLREAFLRWHGAGQRRFRIWSAACSTGEEPYTMAMTLHESGGAQLDIKILATDISTRVLAFSQAGCYPPERMKQVTPNLRSKYFTETQADGEKVFSAKDLIRRQIVFRRLNLSAPPYPMHGPMDVIFCCNVMIYFDNQVRLGFLQEAYRLLKPGGYLIVGHAESLTGMMSSNFKVVRPSIYIKT